MMQIHKLTGPRTAAACLSPGDHVVIHQIDPHGFTGREFHPRKSDEGLIVTVSKMPELTEDSYLEFDAGEPVEIDMSFTVVTCLTDECPPRVLELIDHEIDVMTL